MATRRSALNKSMYDSSTRSLVLTHVGQHHPCLPDPPFFPPPPPERIRIQNQIVILVLAPSTQPESTAMRYSPMAITAAFIPSPSPAQLDQGLTAVKPMDESNMDDQLMANNHDCISSARSRSVDRCGVVPASLLTILPSCCWPCCRDPV